MDRTVQRGGREVKEVKREGTRVEEGRRVKGETENP